MSKKDVGKIILNKASQVKHGLNLTLPMPLRAAILDLIDSRSRQDDHLIPPLRLRRIIGQTDNYTVNRVTPLRTYCGLKPTDAILDVGCGCGSLAYSLIRYYDFQGKYEGFDIIKEFTDWLSENITLKYPNFHFKHANVYSTSYNCTAKILPSKYKFPYPDNTFNVVLVGSVFSHLLPADLENYLSEIVRVLKPNGIVLASYFLLSTQRPRKLKDDEIRSRFVDSGKGYCTTNVEYPEDAIAYDQEYVLGLYQEISLALEHPVVYGELQDLIAARKL